MKPDPIVATEVADRARLDFLPRVAGVSWMLAFESTVYDRARYSCPTYGGAGWRFFDLSNGGAYMAPMMPGAPAPAYGTDVAEGKVRLEVEGNGYVGDVTPDALGVIACICAASDLSFATHQRGDAEACERFSRLYYALRDFACEHAEAAAIFGAID